MDGNGRWGLKKRRSRNYGHLKGLKTVENVIKSSINKQIPYLTLYTFSTENWKRPEKEINFLFDLIRKYIKKNLNKIIKQGIKVNVIGVKKKLPSDIIKNIKIIEEKTLNNKKITINLALNYGSKEEIFYMRK
jgi:undecaprenyl diphosphate synthase